MTLMLLSSARKSSRPLKDAKQRAGAVFRVLYNRSIKILWRAVLFRQGDLLPLGMSWVVHQRNEYLGH